MTPLSWSCPLPGGGIAEEYALTFDRDRAARLLIVPALFDEANRLRRLTVEAMRRLDGAGIDCFLPDLPGCNESLQPLEAQSTDDWRDAIGAAAIHFGASHVLGIRGGCLFTPARLPCWHYAPAKGAGILRQMLRARILASREAGREETRDGLMELAAEQGIELAGYRLGAEFVREFELLEPVVGDGLFEIGQDMIGGSGLWLRAEPGESRQQADALAAVIAMGIGS
jgi:hypothetical protein